MPGGAPVGGSRGKAAASVSVVREPNTQLGRVRGWLLFGGASPLACACAACCVSCLLPFFADAVTSGLGAGGKRAPGLFAVAAASRACSGGEAVAEEGAGGEPVGLLSAVETAGGENAGVTCEHEEGEGNS